MKENKIKQIITSVIILGIIVMLSLLVIQQNVFYQMKHAISVGDQRTVKTLYEKKIQGNEKKERKLQKKLEQKWPFLNNQKKVDFESYRKRKQQLKAIAVMKQFKTKSQAQLQAMQTMYQQKLEKELQKISNDFYTEKITFHQAKKACEAYQMEPEWKALVQTYLKDIKRLETSRQAYQTGLQYQKAGEIAKAILEFEKVISKDQNYTKAQKQLSILKKKYQQEQFKIVKKWANEKNYEKSIAILKQMQIVLPKEKKVADALSLYQNKKKEQEKQAQERAAKRAQKAQLVYVKEARVISSIFSKKRKDILTAIVVNHSGKTVKSYEIVFSAYNKKGKRIKIIHYPKTNLKTYEFLATAGNANIKNGKTYGSDIGWYIKEKQGIHKVKACIKNVTYQDGTTWDNPYYEYWRK